MQLTELTDDREVVTQVVAAWQHDDERFEALVEQMTPRRMVSAAQVWNAQRNAAVRTELLDSWAWMTSEDVADVVQSTAKNRSAAASKLVSDERVLWVRHEGKRLFPRFQFDVERGMPKPVVARLRRIFGERSMSEWGSVIWMTRPTGLLGGKTPVEVLDERPDDVVRAAESIGHAVAG